MATSAQRRAIADACGANSLARAAPCMECGRYDAVMPPSDGYTLFATDIGDCAVAWNARGLTGVWLPEVSAGRLRSRIARRRPPIPEERPPVAVAEAIARITRLIGGERGDLLEVRLDESRLSAFDRSVYAEARQIAPGRVVTYAVLADRVGGGASARAIGQALGRNPFPIVVPCHRIVAAGGELGGFSAPGGLATKRRLLTIENARLDGPADLFDAAATASPSRVPGRPD
jgi:methylated-DNA-[protein]-cysteine S-methyltransferase